MINLMYILLMAMLALNVSSDVLKGFTLVGESLRRTTGNAMKENESIYADLAEQLKGNPAKVKPWFDRAMQVRAMSDSLYNLADRLKWAIAREADGRDGTPDDLQNQEDLEAASHVMLAPVRGQGHVLYDAINRYRAGILRFVTDPKQRAISIFGDIAGVRCDIALDCVEIGIPMLPLLDAKPSDGALPVFENLHHTSCLIDARMAHMQLLGHHESLPVRKPRNYAPKTVVIQLQTHRDATTCCEHVEAARRSKNAGFCNLSTPRFRPR